MSIVAVHGPSMAGLYPGTFDTGQENAVVNPTDGMTWVFAADTSGRPASDFAWDFGSGATPATQAASKGPISVTYSTPGLKTVTLTVSGAGTPPPANGAFVMGITARVGPT